MGRLVTLALVDSRGAPVGMLPPFPVESPWWQEVREIVTGARAAHDIDVVVLRLLSADRPQPPGGALTYLAEYDGPRPAALRAATDPNTWTAPHPLRMPWARPGGPTASLAWANRVLGDARTPVQHRTWNLSSIWRLDSAWLKEVPPFFAHEPAVIDWLGTQLPGLAPNLLAADGPRMLLEHIPGTDRYDADRDETTAMLDRLLPAQVVAADQIEALLALGVPDRRAEPFTRSARAVVDQWAHLLPPSQRTTLTQLVDDLPDRFASLVL